MLVLVVHPETGLVRQTDETEVTQEDMAGIDDATTDIFKFDGNSYWRAAVELSDEQYKLKWQPI